jgi:hypothetical protein
MVLIALLAASAAWFGVSVLARSARTEAEKEARTGQALAKAKQALLAYVTHYAARTDHQVPGRLPCPEPLAPPAGQEGVAASLGCNNNSIAYVGRLPWRTLGIEQLRDGHGEPLWYVLGPGFRAPPINFDSTGGLMLDGHRRGGRADRGAGRGRRQPARSGDATAGLHAQKPGRAALSRPVHIVRPGQLSRVRQRHGKLHINRRLQVDQRPALALSAAELMEAISGPLIDRVQRVVASAIAAWDQAEFLATGRSWGVSHAAPYLPFAAAFGNPIGNSYCGQAGIGEGLPPLAARTAWPAILRDGSASPLIGLTDQLQSTRTNAAAFA